MPLWTISSGWQEHKCRDTAYEIYFSTVSSSPMLVHELTEEPITYCPFCGSNLKEQE